MLAGDRDLKGGHGPSDRDGSRRMGGYQGKTVRDHPTYSLFSRHVRQTRLPVYNKQTHNESMTAFREARFFRVRVPLVAPPPTLQVESDALTHTYIHSRHLNSHHAGRRDPDAGLDNHTPEGSIC